MNGKWPASTVNEVRSRFAPATPVVALRGGSLAWDSVAGAVQYAVYEDGARKRTTTATSAQLSLGAGTLEYQVMAINGAGDESFLSEPMRVVAEDAEMRVKAASDDLGREHAGFTGAGYVPLSLEKNLTVRVPVTVARDGIFAIDVRYANGNGPVNTEDKVAVRTLLADGDTVGVVVMPQRGAGNWTDWGWSNVLRARLTKGPHLLTIQYTQLDANMNRHENSALLDLVRLTRIANLPRAEK
jgi:hypothetical protein